MNQGSHNVGDIVQAFRNMTGEPWKTKNIRLIRVSIPTSDSIVLQRLFETYDGIKGLILVQCTIAEADINHLLNKLRFSTLELIQLHRMHLMDESALVLAAIVQESPLKKLDVPLNIIGSKGCQALANSLADSGLLELNLGFNPIGAVGGLALAHVLSTQNTVLTRLNVFGCNIGKDAMIALVEALPHTKLVEIDLSANVTEGMDDVIYALCLVLERCPLLETLALSRNSVMDEDVIELFKVIPKTNLKKLFFHDNAELTSAIFPEIVQDIKASNTLRILGLQRCRALRNEGIGALYAPLRSHVSFARVMLEHTGVTPVKAAELNLRLGFLHSQRAQLLVALCSAYTTHRIGTRSTIRQFPYDLMRKLKEMLNVNNTK
jgi:Ran GTPase-activating protein (RanGAP) involved in mRNA processing and transport